MYFELDKELEEKYNGWFNSEEIALVKDALRIITILGIKNKADYKLEEFDNNYQLLQQKFNEISTDILPKKNYKLKEQSYKLQDLEKINTTMASNLERLNEELETKNITLRLFENRIDSLINISKRNVGTMTDEEFKKVLKPPNKSSSMIKKRPSSKNSLFLSANSPKVSNSRMRLSKNKSVTSKKKVILPKKTLKPNNQKESSISQNSVFEDEHSMTNSSIDKSFENFSNRVDNNLPINVSKRGNSSRKHATSQVWGLSVQTFD